LPVGCRRRPGRPSILSKGVDCTLVSRAAISAPGTDARPRRLRRPFPARATALSHDVKDIWMANSRQIARIVGPALIALGITEAINIDIFTGNAAPVVYLNGTLLFVAG